MSLNKKQKKQLDVARKKLSALQRRLADARKQPDDPDEPSRLQAEIDTLEREIERLKKS